MEKIAHGNQVVGMISEKNEENEDLLLSSSNQ